MTFTSGQKIQATHYNTFINDLNDVYEVGTGDAGYGATALPTVGTPPPHISANLVDNQNWLDLRAAIVAMGNHQGSVPTLPDVTDLEDKDTQTGGSTQGDDIQAFASFTSAVTTVTDNRLNVGVGSTVVDNSVLSDSRTADWSTQIKHVFTIDFITDDATKDYVDTEVASVGAPIPAFRLDAGPVTAIILGDEIVVLSSGGPGQSVTLPLAVAFPAGATLTLKNGIGTFGATIVPSGPDTIDGVGGPDAGLLVGPLAFTRLISDSASNWYVA